MNLDDIRALSGRPAELCRKYGIADFDLQDDLERLFGRRVDLVAKDGLHRVIRDEVLVGAGPVCGVRNCTSPIWPTTREPFAGTSTAWPRAVLFLMAVRRGMATVVSGAVSVLVRVVLG